MAVVLAPPPASDVSAPSRADGPLVLTANGQLKQLSAADFPVPAEPVERLRVPASFSARSPKHRRDLVSSMRSKLAGRDFDGRGLGDRGHNGRGRRAGRRGRADDGGPDDLEYGARGADSGGARGADSGARDADSGGARDGDAAELRRKLRRHPCHSCPDREKHARYAERYFRQLQEADELDRQIGSRSHVIARTFGKVCAVLDELGYLDGDTVTPDGKRLAGLYSELDLLAAECLRRGFWEGLNPAELAACVSVLSFESRQQDDEPSGRLPKGPVRDVLTAMTRTWTELDQLEKRSGLSFLREPDPGFVWAAYRWVRGAKLEDVLDSVPGLTPGDFVRSTKQLIDLLDQIAGAARIPGAAPGGPRGALGAAPDAGPGGAPGAAPDDGPENAGPQTAPENLAPRDRDVAATARAAIDAMRRGVVAYTGLTD
jgi:ATP-dependent RNA helicase HelY